VQDAALVAELRKERKRSVRRLEKYLRPWQGRAPSKWKRWLQPTTPQTERPWNCHWTAAENAQAVFPILTGKLFAAGAKAAESDDTRTLHRFRLAAKRVRYGLELFAEVYPAAVHQRILSQMSRLQDSLGAISDCDSALTLVGDHTKAHEAINARRLQGQAKFQAHWRNFRTKQESWMRWLGGSNDIVPVAARRSRAKHAGNTGRRPRADT
jgi:CHAD domain-containing protein